MTQGRSDRGRFTSKSEQNREVRSLRLTDSTWQKLGEIAESRRITRADLIEQFVDSGLSEQNPESRGLTLQQVEAGITEVLNDPAVTRNGKDRGSVRRALDALLAYLSPSNTR